MHRRAVAVVIAVLTIVVVGVATVPFTTVVATVSTDEPPPVERPPVTVSDFLPEDANLSDCVGLVEKPGCGSEARGGWRQAAVFTALAIGMAIIIWRISVGVRSNREELERSTRSSDDGPERSP